MFGSMELRRVLMVQSVIESEMVLAMNRASEEFFT